MPFEFGGPPSQNKQGPSSGSGPLGKSGSSSPFGGSSCERGRSSSSSSTCGGFKNVPTYDGGSSSNMPVPFGGQESSDSLNQVDTRSRPVSRRPKMPRAASPGGLSAPDIPWSTIAMVVGVILIILFLWVNRNLISSFIQQIFSWVFMLLIIYVIIKIIFGRRR